MLIEMFKLRQKSSRRNAKRKTLKIDGAEKYTSARHACTLETGAHVTSCLIF